MVEITSNGGGRGRLFYLAIHHQDHYCLAKLITGYPEFEAPNEGIILSCNQTSGTGVSPVQTQAKACGYKE